MGNDDDDAAFLGLSHYCEAHGPNTIFVTKASGSLRTPSSSRISSDWDEGPLISMDQTTDAPLYFLSSNPTRNEVTERLLKHVAIRATSIEGFR
ncbi:Uncharacterized protein FKW44_001559, partial [Caligus rogercresseyi]